MRIKTVFFDLDGTLWSTAEVALLAYRQTFAALGRPLPEPAVLWIHWVIRQQRFGRSCCRMLVEQSGAGPKSYGES